MSGKIRKTWLTPFMAVTYIAVAATGVIMLFHAKMPGLYSLHKWGGLIFVIAGVTHLMLNWRIFASYFKKSHAVWGACLGVIAMLVVAIAFPSGERQHGYNDGLRNGQHYGKGLHRRY